MDHLDRLRELMRAAETGEGVERAALLAELQRVSAWALREVVAEAREGGMSWRELAESLGVATTTLHGQYSSGGGVVVTGQHTAPPPPAEQAPDSFVGRERELADLRPMLSRARLVTVTGPAGVGKTRLVSEYVRRGRKAYPGGVWWVSLAPVPAESAGSAGSAGSAVDGAVTAVLTQAGKPVTSVEEALLAAVGRGAALLVLDNCEHVGDAAASLTARLLPACPRLRIVATSREPLRTSGEVLFPLGPLATKGDDLRAVPALRLFADRAAAVREGFVLTDDLVDAVAELCAGLDGLPLAIELAARQTGVLSPAELVGRLDDRLSVLSGGGHHGSLRAAIGWSYDLLTEQERVAFRHLSLLPGGFDEVTAAVVLPGTFDTDAVWGVLLSLAAKSLVVPDDAVSGRFRMLESLRVFGRELLVSRGELEAAEERLVVWCTGHAQPLYVGIPRLHARLVALLMREHQNLHYATTVARRWKDERCLILASGVALYWDRYRGDVLSARKLLEAVLVERTEPSHSRAVALRSLALVHLHGGDHAGARRHGEAALVLANELGLRAYAAWTLGLLVTIAWEGGDEEAAIALCHERVRLLREVSPRQLLGGLNQLAWTAALLGDVVTAERALDEAELHAGALGVGPDAHTAGLVALLRNRPAEAGDLFCAVLCDPQESAGSVANSVEGAGLTAVEHGEHERGLRLCAAAAAWRVSAGQPADRAWAARVANSAGRARAALPAGMATAAEEGGSALSLADAREYAVTGEWPATDGGHGLLTEREEQVAALVAQGKTDAQIAAHLAISPHTVITHVQHIRTKLNVRSRAQITAWVVSR